MRRATLWLLLAPLWLSGCATGGGAPPMTQLQIREYQTRSFDTQDMKLVMKALINVLQDEGFMIKDANSELGIVAATREMDIEDKGKAFRAWLMWGSNARWDKNSIVEVTANVSSHADQMRVRANFQVKTLNNQGAISKIRDVGDETYYQEFFAKVDKAVFIEKEKL